MGGLLSSSTIDDDPLIYDTLYLLDKLCSNTSFHLNNPFWTHEFNSIAFNLHDLGSKIENIEEEMMRLCNNFVMNNIKTRNLNTLIEHITNELRGHLQNDGKQPKQTTLIHLLLLNRVFMKYFVEVLSLHFKSNQDHQIITEFYQTLILFLYRFLPDLLSKQMEALFTEITSLILSISSTQLYINHKTKDILMEASNESHVFLKQLLNLNTDDLSILCHVLISIISMDTNHTTENHSLNTPDKEGGEERKYFDESGNGFLMNIFHSVYEGWISYSNRIHYDRLNKSTSLLQQHSVLILLLLIHQNNNNTLYDLISKLDDASIHETHGLISGLSASPLLNISFECLFESLIARLTDSNCFSSSLLLLYSLLQHNISFKEYVFAYTEIDRLILPLLRYIHDMHLNEIEMDTHTLYIILIIFLIFSCDSFFAESCFNQIIYGDVDTVYMHNTGFHTESMNPHHPMFESKQKISWYKSCISYPISLGNLIFIVIIDLFQHNVIHLRDRYIHEHCIAILSNMASFCIDLHFYGAQKIINFIHSFIKKINRSVSLIEMKQDGMQLILSVTEQLLCICRLLILNEYMIYCLMNIKKELNQCLDSITNHCESACIRNMKNELSVILKIVDYFYEKVINEAKKCGTALEITNVIYIIHRGLFHWKRIHINDNNNRFQHQQSDTSIEFFLPFIWRLIYKHSGIHFIDDRVKIFKL